MGLAEVGKNIYRLLVVGDCRSGPSLLAECVPEIEIKLSGFEIVTIARKRQRPIKLRDRFIEAVLLKVRVAEVAMRFGPIRPEAGGGFKMGRGLADDAFFK